jgi:protein gp37
MADTSIEWTDASWNPVRGCSRVSAGCENCYAENVARRFSGPGMPYEGLVRLTKDGKAKAQWSGEVRFVADKLAEPLTWRKPKRVFVNSMSDLFHNGVSFEQIAAIFGVMAAAPQHTFQVLTKRPERARAFFEWVASQQWSTYDTMLSAAAAHVDGEVWEDALERSGLESEVDFFEETWPLANVWLGVSVEDQASADKRIPHLLECPAAVRWVSYEPAIEAVSFRKWMLPKSAGAGCWHGGRLHPWEPGERCPPSRDGQPGRIDWVVVGGESGPGARPFDLAWARSVIAQCMEANVACFVKQLGARPVFNVSPTGNFRTSPTTGKREYESTGERLMLRDRKGGDVSEWPNEPNDLRVRQWPGESR